MHVAVTFYGYHCLAILYNASATSEELPMPIALLLRLLWYSFIK